MDVVFNPVSEIATGKDGWRIKVRVIRLWSVPTFMKPDQTNSLEMVLIDEKGTKIQASVRKQLLYVFQSKITERKVYKISCFSVAPSVGSYRTTQHPYKIMFQMTTKVQVSESSTIPSYGISLTKVSDVLAHSFDYDYLVDVVGLMTAISTEREYIRDGNVTKMVVFELSDDSGKVECALFGAYVDSLNKLMGKAADGMPVVLVQFAKLKIFKDKASLQNVLNTTRILINPPIQESAWLRKSLSARGVDLSAVPVLGPRIRASVEVDFLRMYPKKTLEQLLDTPEDGTFIVYATIDGFVDGEEWWYPACKCHRSVSPDSGAYFCKGCDKHVFQMVPRYRVKINVSDATSVAVFVIFDGDVQSMVNVSCSSLVAAKKAENAGSYPVEFFTKLRAKKMLFKVEKSAGASIFFDGSFRVKRVCDDPSIIEKFDSIGVDYTPSKLQSKKVVNDPSDLPPAVDEEEGASVEEFLDGVIVTPKIVLDVASQEFSKTVASGECNSFSTNEVAGGSAAETAESSSKNSSVVDGSSSKFSGCGVKRNLAGSFVEVDSDDETLSQRIAKLREV